jgi:hypothetical protein
VAAGIAIGAIAAVTLLLFVGFVLVRRRRRKRLGAASGNGDDATTVSVVPELDEGGAGGHKAKLDPQEMDVSPARGKKTS